MAGSENIARSGAIDKRAREAGMYHLFYSFYVARSHCGMNYTVANLCEMRSANVVKFGQAWLSVFLYLVNKLGLSLTNATRYFCFVFVI